MFTECNVSTNGEHSIQNILPNQQIIITANVTVQTVYMYM